MLDGGAREIDGITGRRYHARNGGVFDMHPADAKALVEIGGAPCSMAGTTRRGLGYRCPSCGFGSYFKICSRCGDKTVRERIAV